MNRTNTAIGLATAAMCATVLVSNAVAEPAPKEPTAGATGVAAPEVEAPEGPKEAVAPTVTTTVTTQPTVTVTKSTSTTPTTTTVQSGQLAVLQAFSSGDFSNVSTPAVVLFVLGILTALANLGMQLDPEQVQAAINDARKQLPNLPF